jgi:hypothetical protein
MQNMLFHDTKYKMLYIWSTVSSRRAEPWILPDSVNPHCVLKTRFLQKGSLCCKLVALYGIEC